MTSVWARLEVSEPGIGDWVVTPHDQDGDGGRGIDRSPCGMRQHGRVRAANRAALWVVGRVTEPQHEERRPSAEERRIEARKGHEQARRHTAERLDRDHPSWAITWGCYTDEFIAWPLFGGPRLAISDPNALASAMRQAEGRWRSGRPGPT